jgi:hypothetical protein
MMYVFSVDLELPGDYSEKQIVTVIQELSSKGGYLYAEIEKTVRGELLHRKMNHGQDWQSK